MSNPPYLLTSMSRPFSRLLPRRIVQAQQYQRAFHISRRRDVIKPFLLADIGEGTRECQIIQWFVQPGARVEQFDKICEVQSDKTASDITSPFDGVIKKLYYEADDMAIVGKPLVDIDIQSEITPEDEEQLGGSKDTDPVKEADNASVASESSTSHDTKSTAEETIEGPLGNSGRQHSSTRVKELDSPHRTLATPAVRHLLKELDVNIADVEGTGKDGRVLKEDVHRHVSRSTQQEPQLPVLQQPAAENRNMSLTPMQVGMFKTMTRSLSIPHFLYTMTVDMTSLTNLRERLNRKRSPNDKITPLPFILKAASLAFAHHPLLNASLDTSDPKKPELTYKAAHHFGVAVDTPSGLIVPVVRDVQTHSISSLASQIKSLGAAARQGKLQAADLQGASFTVSNIGSIGGGVVAPIIVEPQVAILGVGRSRIVPAFDADGNLCKKEELVLSWSADHRIVDGAECARAAERVKTYLEAVDEWVLEMR